MHGIALLIFGETEVTDFLKHDFALCSNVITGS